MARFLLRGLTLAGVGVVLWLWAFLGRPAAEAPPGPPPPPLPAARPAPVAPRAPVVASEVGESARLPIRELPPSSPPPARRTLEVHPPPPPPPALPAQAPRLPDAVYPEAAPQPLAAARFQAPSAPSTGLSPRDYVQRAESCSAQLDRLIRQHKVEAQFVGTGRSGEMVQLVLSNTSNRPITVQLVPGMILRPPDGQAVQPLMLDEETTISLAPGTTAYRDLASYCMNSRVPAPFAYENVDYRFSSRTREGGAETVRVFQAAQELPIQSELPPEEHRRAVTQIALWKSMGQPVDDERLRSAMGAAFYNPKLRQQILRDVQEVLRRSR